MTTVIICAVIVGMIALVSKFLFNTKWFVIPLSIIITLGINSLIVFIDYKSQTDCLEVWSGKIISNKHIEEWDEYHKPWDETVTEKDSKGKKHTKVIHHEGYWEHHNAENYITTSDNGEYSISKTPDGKELNDSFVNSTQELNEYYPINKPTASVHIYENKVQASYSIYKHKDINIKDYPNLPSYPKDVNSEFNVTRVIGEVSNKQESIDLLNEVNSRLNDTNNSNNKDKVKSYKQVNIIFVNLGDVTEDYGIALQDYWQGGNKNDFVIAFGTKDEKVTWCYPFSWSEVEILKSEVRDYMLDNCDLNKFTATINDTANMIEQKFERKQFADFNYLDIETSATATTIIIVFTVICGIGVLFSNVIFDN